MEALPHLYVHWQLLGGSAGRPSLRCRLPLDQAESEVGSCCFLDRYLDASVNCRELLVVASVKWRMLCGKRQATCQVRAGSRLNHCS